MVFREAVQKAGLESRGLSTHSSRRSFVTHLARNGVSLRIIQKLLGYADLKMLAVYIDLWSDVPGRNPPIRSLAKSELARVISKSQSAHISLPGY